MTRIAVVGAGAWGTALAQTQTASGNGVVLWARDPELAATIAARRENPAYLPGVALSPNLTVTARSSDLAGVAIVLLAVPAQHLGSTLAGLPDFGQAPLVVAAKGIETQTLRLMPEVAAAARPGAPIALLSGPSFAAEVARGLPTALTLACADAALGAELARTLGHRTFRLYRTDDVTGVAIGGALKNVLAIAAGMVMGRRLGENARAALVARGVAELMRVGSALGVRPETLAGLSGLGDLVLTATSLQSRNTALGAALGEGRPLPDLLAGRHSVVEGVATAAAAARLAERHAVDAPITAAVDAVLNRGARIDATIAALLDRPLRAEQPGP